MHPNYFPNIACLRVHLDNCRSTKSLLQVLYALYGGSRGSQEAWALSEGCKEGSDVKCKENAGPPPKCLNKPKR